MTLRLNRTNAFRAYRPLGRRSKRRFTGPGAALEGCWPSLQALRSHAGAVSSLAEWHWLCSGWQIEIGGIYDLAAVAVGVFAVDVGWTLQRGPERLPSRARLSSPGGTAPPLTDSTARAIRGQLSRGISAARHHAVGERRAPVANLDGPTCAGQPLKLEPAEQSAATKTAYAGGHLARIWGFDASPAAGSRLVHSSSPSLIR